MKTKACLIYPIRPLACRRIYSLHRCSQEQPPVLNRQVMRIAADTIADLQRLDANGYSGHLSFILHMLAAPRFMAVYTSGGFKPEEIMAFGKSHRIVVNGWRPALLFRRPLEVFPLPGIAGEDRRP